MWTGARHGRGAEAAGRDTRRCEGPAASYGLAARWQRSDRRLDLLRMGDQGMCLWGRTQQEQSAKNSDRTSGAYDRGLQSTRPPRVLWLAMR